MKHKSLFKVFLFFLSLFGGLYLYDKWEEYWDNSHPVEQTEKESKSELIPNVDFDDTFQDYGQLEFIYENDGSILYRYIPPSIGLNPERLSL